jgi:2-polyprenyl-3-methyl-5-hydroxy-6-metoxy-1,4-benzoquinol methylase
VWGVEPNVEQAAIARQSYAGVVTAMYPDALDQLEGNFDCITFNHVLEHMLDPWEAMERTRERLAPGGSVVAVIPNIRYLTVLMDLAFRGRWEYQDTGLLDRTHLRFFTRGSVRSLFEDAGLRIDRLIPVNGFASVSHPVLSRIGSRVLGDITYGSFAVRASHR